MRITYSLLYYVVQGTLWYTAGVDESGRDWLAQARRGVIELCVLQLIAQHARYGYELSTALAQLGKPLAATEGTLYPLLRRLQRDGVVEATWQESRDGPPRKYYHLSAAGRRLLEAQRAEWEELTQAVANLRNEASHVDEEVPDGTGSQRQPTLSRRAQTPTGASARPGA
jgi:PadR family transcriptional regulator